MPYQQGQGSILQYIQLGAPIFSGFGFRVFAPSFWCQHSNEIPFWSVKLMICVMHDESCQCPYLEKPYLSS
jgi:hypothetical protein